MLFTAYIVSNGINPPTNIEINMLMLLQYFNEIAFNFFHVNLDNSRLNL